MPRDLYARYIWLVETLRRYGRLTRLDIDYLWQRSELSGGNPLPRRSFHNYRTAAEEMFKIEIKCDPATFEYYIDEEGGEGVDTVTDWLLKNAATNELLTKSRDLADRIFVENIPSALTYLSSVVEAMREDRVIQFDYASYARTALTQNILFAPYALKLFKQRWYMTGRTDGKIKTYALDRIRRLHITQIYFTRIREFDPQEYFRYNYGIMSSTGKVHEVVLRAEGREAKYLRDLPLHHTQREEFGDNYSIFRYQMRLTADLLDELMAHSPRLVVLEPPALREALRQRLEDSLKEYEE